MPPDSLHFDALALESEHTTYRTFSSDHAPLYECVVSHRSSNANSLSCGRLSSTSIRFLGTALSKGTCTVTHPSHPFQSISLGIPTPCHDEVSPGLSRCLMTLALAHLRCRPGGLTWSSWWSSLLPTGGVLRIFLRILQQRRPCGYGRVDIGTRQLRHSKLGA